MTADCCPICLEPMRPGDLCATDITEGTCHAECLQDCPVVDLNTGDEIIGGKLHTFAYEPEGDEDG